MKPTHYKGERKFSNWGKNDAQLRMEREVKKQQRAYESRMMKTSKTSDSKHSTSPASSYLAYGSTSATDSKPTSIFSAIIWSVIAIGLCIFYYYFCFVWDHTFWGIFLTPVPLVAIVMAVASWINLPKKDLDLEETANEHPLTK